MIEIRLHEVIDSESNAWFYEWMGMGKPFSLETLQQVMDENPGQGLRFQIHCNGGLVTEGLAIYDALRTSGRTIECNVEGDCHSMAIVLLLAAPKDRRTSNPNASFLIHEVNGGVQGNTTAVERYAEEMRALQDRILDIYADRTGQNREELEDIMKEEKVRDAEFMLAHGFISSINSYNTNQTNMTLLESLKNLISRAESEGGGVQAPANEELAQLNARLAQLQGERDEALGRVETLTAERDSARAEVETLTAERDSLNSQVTDLTAQVETVTGERDQAQAQVAEQAEEINTLKGQLGSHYQPGNRLNGKPAGEGEQAKSREEQLNECRDKLGWNRKK